ncbi:hypothetical protein E8E11_008676 [Didymella keratinophila]|nr:hypothetical protein E8E11_008676 [Didymella keratinophila]
MAATGKPRDMMKASWLLGLATIAYGTDNFKGPAWTPESPCPTSISASIGTSGGDWCAVDPDTAYCRFPNTTVIHSALIHCPAVEELDIYFEVGGCTGPEVDRWNLPVELLQESQKYPPLKRLKLDGYSFGGLWERVEEEAVDPKDVTDVKLYEDEWDDYDALWPANQYTDERNARVQEAWERDGKSKTNLDMWIEVMNWSQLEELSINNERSEMAEVASKLPQRLTALRSLHLNSFTFIQGLKEHALEKLKWVGKTKKGQLEQILHLQGKSLKSVEYRCDEASCSDLPQHVDVPAIAELAPHLQHISLNMPRVNGTWPLNDLKALASIPSLTSAELYFRLQSDCELYGQYLSGCFRCGNAWREWRDESWNPGGCRGDLRYASPYLNTTTAQEMFAYLRTNKLGAKLEEVTFKAGDWTGPYDGPLRSGGFLDGQRVMITCKSDADQNVCETMRRSEVWD